MTKRESDEMLAIGTLLSERFLGRGYVLIVAGEQGLNTISNLPADARIQACEVVVRSTREGVEVRHDTHTEYMKEGSDG